MDNVGTHVRFRVGAYAVFALRAVIPEPAKMDEKLADKLITLLHPPAILE